MRLFGWLSRRHPSPPEVPMGVSVLTEGGVPVLVVRYGDYPTWDTQAITDDPWRKHRTAILRLAFRATTDATWVEPRVVESRRIEFSDDLYCTYEVRVPPTTPNMIALLASGLEWTAEASELARRAAIPDAAVEASRGRMRMMARDEKPEMHLLQPPAVEDKARRDGFR